jgi:hypothetical protein
MSGVMSASANPALMAGAERIGDAARMRRSPISVFMSVLAREFRT